VLEFNFSPFPIIETERLIMRKVTLDDKDAFFELRTNPIVNRYIDRDPMKSVEEAEELILKIIGSLDNNDAISWTINLKGNDRMIGSIDFWRIDKNHHRAEIGYTLHPDYHHQGIMSEAMDAALEHGFKHMKLHSVEANVNPANAASKKILEKHGFVLEAYFRENYHYNGKFLDSLIYSLLNKYDIHSE